MLRTHTCGELNSKSIGKQVELSGWVSTRRDHGKLTFIDLRDRYGITQCVFNPEKHNKTHSLAKDLRSEFVVKVNGKVQKRPSGTENKDIPTGDVEVEVEELEIFSPAEPLPFELDGRIEVNEDLRMKHRYLDLRTERMKKNIEARHRIVKVFRDYFDKLNFLEIETPMLAKSTPEGARDYLVPSRVHAGKFYALPQSPQIYKQLLMLSGLDRYVQIVKCFRDEDLRADRQPEFTQVDVEMSFIEQDDIIRVIEGAVELVMKEYKGLSVKTPFPRMTYEEAMDRFGSDKPDTRFGLELIDLSKELSDTEFNIFNTVLKSGGVLKAIVAPGMGGHSRKEHDKLHDVVKVYGAKGLSTLRVEKTGFDSQISKFLKEKHFKEVVKKTNAKEGDLILIVADKPGIVNTSLGELRNYLGRKLELIDKSKFNFLWVVDFPLFEWDDDDERWKSMHHPFTSPINEDVKYLEKEPGRVRSNAYDLVLNGSEIGGGSIRIHNREMQQRMFKALGISESEAQEKFGFMMDSFKYGAPPHGGIALGLDRFVALLAEEDSIREVVAFPKNKAAEGVMEGSPSEVDDKQLKELSLKKDLKKK